MPNGEEDDFGDVELGDRVPPVCADIVHKLVAHFMEPVLQDKESDRRIRLFAQNGRQMEPWLCGEIMYLLEKIKIEQIGREWALSEWWTEVRYDWQGGKERKTCDIVLKITKSRRKPTLAGIELKVGFAGRQCRRTLIPVPPYVSNGPLSQRFGLGYLIGKLPDDGGVLRDAARLARSGVLKERVCIVLCYGDKVSDGEVEAFMEKLNLLGAQLRAPWRTFKADILPTCQFPCNIDGGFWLRTLPILIRPDRPGNPPPPGDSPLPALWPTQNQLSYQ